mgnify:CR=1 FL=1
MKMSHWLDFSAGGCYDNKNYYINLGFREEKGMEEKFVILADSTCDLSGEIRERFGINDYIPGFVTFSDGRDFDTVLDWSRISRDDFYRALSDRRMKLTTAPATVDMYAERFEKYVAAGYKVLSMSISSKISSTFNNVLMAAETVRRKYPEGEIYCFDSLRISGGLGFLVVAAQQMKNEGKSFREIIDWLESHKACVHQMGPIDDLTFIARRGTISTGKAILGNFAGIKPMGDCNSIGYVSVLTKVKGIKNALGVTVEYFKRTVVDPERFPILIFHSDREEYADFLKTQLEAAVPGGRVFVSDVFSGSGVNIGPGMIGVYYLGEPVSENSEREKAVMESILSAGH